MEKPIEVTKTPTQRIEKITNFILKLMVIGFITFALSTILPFNDPITKINLTFGHGVEKSVDSTLYNIPNNHTQSIIIETQKELIDYQKGLITKYRSDVKYLLKLAKDNNIEVIGVIQEETLKE